MNERQPNTTKLNVQCGAQDKSTPIVPKTSGQTPAANDGKSDA